MSAALDPANEPVFDPVALALDVVDQFAAGRFDEAEVRFSPQLRAAVSAQAVARQWREELGEHQASDVERGPVSLRTRPDGLVTATVPVRTPSGAMDVLMSVDADRVLHGLRFAPPSAEKWTPPGYANERRFTEEEITLGSGDESVPGTLTLPRGPLLGRALGRRAPAVVLLAGGGPFDRDESSGPNKPLKDLAWGLATHGIAVLRFDKATVVHAEAMNERGYTLTQEYVPHAVAAVRLLQRHRAVDPKRVFVLGHSAGGKAVPRVAAAESSVAGLILLAADAAPMHETAVRVAQHIAAMEPGPDADAAVAELTALAERAADPGLDTNVPASQLPFGLPAAYWLDLRGYDAVAVAAAAGRPMFIAQGGRDYQVTVEHDFALWREGLRDRPDVHCRVYEADDHLFFPGTDPSTPASYRAPQHVDPALVADVAEWIKAR